MRKNICFLHALFSTVFSAAGNRKLRTGNCLADLKLETKNLKLLLFAVAVFLLAALPAWGEVIDLPRTGQMTSYADGDDGDIQAGAAWPEPRFTDSGATVTDNLTGLMWIKDAGTPTVGSCTGGTRTWHGALDYVACLNAINGGAGYLGHNDWRLPNVNELYSLLDWSRFDPAIPGGYPFTNVQSNWYWSSTTNAGYTVNAWVVDMWYGYVSYNYKGNDNYYGWPVRGGQCGLDPSVICLPKTGQTTCYDWGSVIPCAGTGQDGDIQAGIAWPNPGRFTDNSDTVTDNLTGLMWTKDAGTPTVTEGTTICTGGYMTWQRALDYMECLNTINYLGHHDWRVPNVNELHSIRDFSQFSPALPADNPFTNVQSGWYWSSTTYAYDTGYAWFSALWGGSVSPDVETAGDKYVWPVRGGIVISCYTVTPSAERGGSISPSTPQTVCSGETISFTIIPNTGYYIASITGCDGSLSGNTYTTGPITSDCTVTATFTINPYTVTPSAGPGGTISPNTPQTVAYNDRTSFTVAPNAGYIASVTTDCGGGPLVGSSTYTYTTGPITADCSVSASFFSCRDCHVSPTHNVTHPGSCTSCHTEIDTVPAGKNTAVCESCHASDNPYPKNMATINHVNTSASVPDSCATCHVAVVTGEQGNYVAVIVPDEGMEPDIYCGSCHATDGSGVGPPMSTDALSASAAGMHSLVPDLVVFSLSVPSNGVIGASISIGDTTKNSGTGSAESSTTRFYLSTNTTLDGGDTLLGSRSVHALNASTSSAGTTSVTIPPGTAAGTYYIIAKADDLNVVSESNENNNTRVKGISIYQQNQLPTVGHGTVGYSNNNRTVTFTDTSSDDNPSTATVYVNWGDGSPLSSGAIDGVFSHTYGTANTFNIAHKVKDAAGLVAKETFTVDTRLTSTYRTVTVNTSPALGGASVYIKTLTGLTRSFGSTNTGGSFVSSSLTPAQYKVYIYKTGKTFDCDPGTAGNQMPVTVDISSVSQSVTCTYTP